MWNSRLYALLLSINNKINSPPDVLTTLVVDETAGGNNRINYKFKKGEIGDPCSCYSKKYF